MTNRYDLVIVGAGSGGLVAARFAAQLGAKVALIEKNRVGGDCTWTGCVPSKALLKVAKVASEIRTARGYGISASSPEISMPAVREYLRKTIASVYKFESPEVLAEEGIEVILGAAKFTDPSTISVGDRVIQSKAFLLTTGARPAIPAISGLERVPFSTYEHIFENDSLPGKLLIIGAGPIGLEMAQAYQRLGSQVTVFGRAVLPKEDRDVQGLIKTVLEGEGVCFVLERVSAARAGGRSVTITTETEELTGDLLLVAAGRKPNLEGLDLEKAGVKYSSAGVFVDDRLRTNVHHIYAAGDVTGGYQFTHYAGWQGFQAVRNALLPGSASGINEVVPWVTFTDPEVAHVGLTEQEARAKHGDRVEVHRWDLGKVDRAVCENDGSGFIKIIADHDGLILGASMIASRAGETIVELVIAMKNKLKISDLAGTIHPYPTYSTAVQQMVADITVERLLSGTSGKLIRGVSRAIR